MLGLLALGLSNGHNTGSLMTKCANRYENIKEKEKIGYFTVLFIMTGLTSATLINETYKFA